MCVRGQHSGLRPKAQPLGKPKAVPTPAQHKHASKREARLWHTHLRVGQARLLPLHLDDVFGVHLVLPERHIGPHARAGVSAGAGADIWRGTPQGQHKRADGAAGCTAKSKGYAGWGWGDHGPRLRNRPAVERAHAHRDLHGGRHGGGCACDGGTGAASRKSLSGPERSALSAAARARLYAARVAGAPSTAVAAIPGVRALPPGRGGQRPAERRRSEARAGTLTLGQATVPGQH